MVYFPEPVFKLVCSFLGHTISDLAKKYPSQLFVSGCHPNSYVTNLNERPNKLCNGYDVIYQNFIKVVNLTDTQNTLRYNFTLVNCTDTILSRIDRICLEVGRQLFESVYPEMFDCLYNLYDIQKYSGVTDKNIVIPFYCSKIGIPVCLYHHAVDIKIYFKKILQNNTHNHTENSCVTIKYSTCEYTHNHNTPNNLPYALYTVYWNTNTKIIHSNLLVYAFIVETTEPTISVKLNNDLLVMTRTQQIGKFGLFRVSHNYDNCINFNIKANPRMVKEYKVHIVNVITMEFINNRYFWRYH